MRCVTRPAIVALFVGLGSCAAQPPQTSTPISNPKFVLPQLLSCSASAHPPKKFADGIWAGVNYAVDDKGRVVLPAQFSSSDDSAYENVDKDFDKWVLRSEDFVSFKPATLDGVAVGALAACTFSPRSEHLTAECGTMAKSVICKDLPK